MTVASEITRIKTNIANAYNSASEKGATLPDVQNSDNLATCISSITGGGSSGSSSKYGVSIDDILGDVDNNGVLQQTTGSFNVVFNGVKDVGEKGLYCKFYASSIANCSFPDLENATGKRAFEYAFDNSTLSEIDFPKLTNISGTQAFLGAFEQTSISKVPFTNLKTVTGRTCLSHVFNGCKNLITIEFPELESVSGYSCFQYVAGISNSYLETISFPKLKTVQGERAFDSISNSYSKLKKALFPLLESVDGGSSGYAFRQAFRGDSINEVDFTSLISILGNKDFFQTFYGCKSLTTISFPSLTDFGTTYINQLDSVFYNCTNLTEIHFRADAQATIEGLTGYSSKFGATNATIYFDL